MNAAVDAMLPPLPPLKRLGAATDFRPTIVTDTREQMPLIFRRLPSMPGSLVTGDYSIQGAQDLFAVERKSIPDLAACCCGANRDRFERELHRLRGFPFQRLLIVGSRTEVEQHRYRSGITPRAVLSTLAAFEVRYVPVVWSATPEEAASLIERWAWWFAREMVQEVNGLNADQPVTSEATNVGAQA